MEGAEKHIPRAIHVFKETEVTRFLPYFLGVFWQELRIPLTKLYSWTLFQQKENEHLNNRLLCIWHLIGTSPCYVKHRAIAVLSSFIRSEFSPCFISQDLSTLPWNSWFQNHDQIVYNGLAPLVSFGGEVLHIQEIRKYSIYVEVL